MSAGQSEAPRSDPQSGPVLIDLETEAEAPGAAVPNPAEAPPVPEPDQPAPIHSAALARLAQGTGGPGFVIWRGFAAAATALIVMLVGLAAWNTVVALMARSPLLAGAVSLALGLTVLFGLLLVLRELAALSRLSSLAKLRETSEEVLRRGDLNAARRLSQRLTRFYAKREGSEWGAAGLGRRVEEAFDADAVLDLTERALLERLDEAARNEVEAAARQVATVTALVPLALADLITALVVNIRMIRRISEIYGGRAGSLGAWRLARRVLAHLVATGALAVGDDLLGSLAGGGVASRLSRRFGEGVVNGALTARVGVAAMELSRPLPFRALPRPSVSALIKRALTGLFAGAKPSP